MLSKLAHGHPGGKAGTLRPGLVVAHVPCLAQTVQNWRGGREGNSEAGSYGGVPGTGGGKGKASRSFPVRSGDSRAVCSVDWLRNGGQGQHL